ncbi:MAG: hypothetical protein LBK07_06645 [Tannerella sp.]|jgi:hypothetical protein|nr:hypothetical protein [Tannerella sp.]
MKAIHVIFAVLCLWCMTAVRAGAAANDVRKLIGSWEVTVPDAPFGYQNYTIDIREADGQYLMDVKGDDFEVKDSKLTEKDGRLSTEIYVGENVTVTVWEEDGAVKGSADTTQGVMTCLFKKAKQTQ